MNPFRDLFTSGDAAEGLLARYTNIEYLRHGAFSEVFKAYDVRERRFVAIKVVRSEIFRVKNTPTWILKHIINEAERAQKSTFRNVVNLFDVVIGDSSIAFFSEFCSDGDLERILRDPPAYVSEDDYLERFLVQMISGVIEMKRAGLCCRAIGSENILVQCLPGKWPTFKISDLGMTKHLVCLHDWTAHTQSCDEDPQPEDAVGTSYIRSLGGILWRLQNTVRRSFDSDKQSVETSDKTPMKVIIESMLGNDEKDPSIYQVMRWLCKERRITQVPKIWMQFLQERFRLINATFPMNPIIPTLLLPLQNSDNHFENTALAPVRNLFTALQKPIQKEESDESNISSSQYDASFLLDSLIENMEMVMVYPGDGMQDVLQGESIETDGQPKSLPEHGGKLLVSQSIWNDAINKL
uniref:Serine/threonine protein kinase n=1 Tax=Clandestinovirus TaxID=2831644 RepID=A0A8F8PN57_9VIRU|nr:serine/threonine protein kinase [Clandestinovirus]